MKMLRKILLVVLCGVIAAAAVSVDARRRSSRDVRRERERNEQQMTQTKSRLQQNTGEVRRQLNRLSSLEATIAMRGDTIADLQGRINGLTASIDAINDTIARLESRAAALKTNYGAALRAMRSRRQGMSDLAFIFSAKTFAQAWSRLRYLREVAKASARRAAQVREAADAAKAARARLDEMRAALQTSMNRLQATQASLNAERASAANLVSSLRREGRALNAELERRRRAAANLENELEQVIRREAEEQRQREAEERRRREAEERQRREEEARRQREAEQRRQQQAQQQQQAQSSQSAPSTPSAQPAKPQQSQQPQQSQSAQRTPSAQTPQRTQPTQTASANVSALTGSFAANKGKLPMPVVGRYAIVSKFGTNTYRDLSKVQVTNLGIDIEATPGSSARSVFEGTVTAVVRIDGHHNVVLVRHGEYITVYAGIDKLAVRKGDKVKTGQTLGTIYVDAEDDNRTVLHFEVRRETQKLNPTEWVR